MSIQTSTEFAALPRVNLLPPEIAEHKQLQRIQAALVVATVAAVGAVSFLYVEGRHSVSDAHQKVGAATQQSQQLSAKLATFSDVKATATQAQAAEASLTRAMGTEISWSDYLADLSAILPGNTWLTQATLSETIAPGSLAAPNQAPAQVGNATFQGYGMNYPAVAAWLDSLQPEKGFSNIYFSTASESYIGPTKVVGFTGSVSLTEAALTDRCQTAGSC